MSKHKEILALVRSINADEFQEQLTQGDSLDDLQKELLHLAEKIESKKKRTDIIIEHISNCYAGDFFNLLPISEAQDELDVFCMGFNTYIEELKAVMVSKSVLKKKNKKLLKEKKRSKRLAKVKDEFMSSMSHEIRTPLNGILGFTDLLLKSNSLDADSRTQLGYVKMSGDILQTIINDILDLAKIESGQVILYKQPFNLPKLTQLVYNTFAIKTIEKEIDFSISIDENVPADLIGDSTRISQILFNLVSNAVKFTPKRGKIKLKIQLSREENGYHFIQISVKDTGIGISSNKIKSIFDPFIQVSDDAARKYGGTGLGLSIIKKIITFMDGEIHVKSKLGSGTKFTTTIPFLKCNSGSYVSKSTINDNNPTVPISDKKIKILLAEDNRINQLLAQKVLLGLNMDCTTVDNGKLAVEALQKESFDLVLMDLMMPEMDGYEAAMAIRSMKDDAKKNIPIIALTASVFDSVTEKCISAGMDKYLSKPFKTNELHSMIMELVQKSKNLNMPLIKDTNLS